MIEAVNYELMEINIFSYIFKATNIRKITFFSCKSETKSTLLEIVVFTCVYVRVCTSNPVFFLGIAMSEPSKTVTARSRN